VKEFEIETTNPFVGIFNRLLRVGRKLKPIVKKRQTISFDTIKECKIYVHVLKGENVPIRSDFIKEFTQS
jgi:hypothetical protein